MTPKLDDPRNQPPAQSGHTRPGPMAPREGTNPYADAGSAVVPQPTSSVMRLWPLRPDAVSVGRSFPAVSEVEGNPFRTSGARSEAEACRRRQGSAFFVLWVATLAATLCGVQIRAFRP